MYSILKTALEINEATFFFTTKYNSEWVNVLVRKNSYHAGVVMKLAKLGPDERAAKVKYELLQARTHTHTQLVHCSLAPKTHF